MKISWATKVYHSDGIKVEESFTDTIASTKGMRIYLNDLYEAINLLNKGYEIEASNDNWIRINGKTYNGINIEMIEEHPAYKKKKKFIVEFEGD